MLNVTSRWQGGFVVNNPELSKSYTFKPQGWFKPGYEVADDQNEVLFTIQGNFVWKKLNSGFTIICNDDFGVDEPEVLLMLLSVHLHKAMQTAAVIGAAS
jgi:hypothetical protein